MHDLLTRGMPSCLRQAEPTDGYIVTATMPSMQLVARTGGSGGYYHSFDAIFLCAYFDDAVFIHC